MGARRQAREAALQILYLMDIVGLELDEAARTVWYGQDLRDKSRSFADKLASGAAEHRKELDAVIARYAENWDIGRMAVVDRNVLRLASYELIHQPDTPVSVIIDEAVEIAKSYSTNDSGKFVNGILDKIKTERTSGESPAS